MVKILTVGVYDILHKGHVELFRRAKALGDYLIVAVQDSSEVLKYKPKANLLNSTEDRCLMVNSVKFVDEVVVYDSVDNIIPKINFDILVTGPDQIHEGFQKAIKWCIENEKKHIVLSRTQGVSSSEIKKRIISDEKN